ncbi:glycoside hydrolase family 13 protein [Nocardioidaceae bacterium SCSIO 66511]|nr:glycoside hydrolase family 13 protein [Nocardioidaceae bacterium SCSIO 66511]
MTPSARPLWWRHAVCYQIYVRSFADSNGDGIGDLAGITSRIPYLADLGIDAVWLTPFYPSPQADHGYDVADYRDVDPLFGDLDDFDAMLAQAHRHGIRVIADIVPNHSSTHHRWFREALASAPGSAERARYHFRPGGGHNGDEPPNNWQSIFGGPAWTRIDDGSWYLHLFDASQPDFNWDNADVGDEFDSVLRFWLDRGVDGFRIDVAHGMFKAPGLPDLTEVGGEGGVEAAISEWDRPYWNQPGIHDVFRRWHRVLAEYPGDRMAIGEAWVATPEAMARYVRPDELQQCFNFHWLDAVWSAEEFREVIRQTYAAVAPVDATPTWVLSNHDVTRTVTRYGGGAVGLARARAALLAMFGLPGSAYVYAGEELGLPQVDVAPSDRQDPTWLRGGGEGRDGCRVPLPWSGTSAPFGFGPATGQPWLPQPDYFADLTVDEQRADPGSTLNLVREALAIRRGLLPSLPDEIELLDLGDDVLAYRRGALTCIVNCGERWLQLPPGTRLLASTGQVATSLPPDTAVWLGD